MPCLSGKFDPGIGPIINVGIHLPDTIKPKATSNFQITAFPALIDTGASITCISTKVAQAVNLEPMGKRPMTSATHSIPVNIYLVDLFFPFGKAGFIQPNIQVMEFTPAGESPFQMLVGRDIICQGTFALSFDGHFTFCL